MKIWRELAGGLGSALIMVIIVLSALSLSFIEGGIPPLPNLPAAPAETETPTRPAEGLTPPAQTAAVASPAPLSSPTITKTPTAPLPTICPNPAGWKKITLKSGDSLEKLAKKYKVEVAALRKANCLVIDTLLPETTLFVPPLPPTAPPPAEPSQTPSRTPVPCGPPGGWVRYIIRSGDTLFNLSIRVGASVPQLQFANCLGSSTYIRAGDGLYVPFIPGPISVNTATRTATQVPVFTLTPTRVTPTPTRRPTTAVPPTVVVPSATPVTPSVAPPSATPVTPSVVPPSATPVPPTATEITPVISTEPVDVVPPAATSPTDSGG